MGRPIVRLGILFLVVPLLPVVLLPTKETGAPTTDALVRPVSGTAARPAPLPMVPAHMPAKMAASSQPSSISVDPDFAIRPLGGDHRVLSSVTDQTGNPAPGVLVRFEVHRGDVVVEEGVNETNEVGLAGFEYFGPNTIADDLILACASTSEEGPTSCLESRLVKAEAVVLWRHGFFCRASVIRLEGPAGVVEPLVAGEDGTCGERVPGRILSLDCEQTALAALLSDGCGTYIPGEEPTLLTIDVLSASTTQAGLGQGFPHYAFAEAGVARIVIEDVLTGAGVFSAEDLYAQVHVDCTQGVPVFSSWSSALGTTNSQVLPVPGLGTFFTNEERFSEDGSTLIRTALRFVDESGAIGSFVVAEASAGLDQCITLPLEGPAPKGWNIIKL